MEQWAEALEKHGAPLEKAWFSEGKKERETFREFRHRLPEKVNHIVKSNKLPKVGTDIAVPATHFREMMGFYKEKFEGSRVNYLVFGHIGDCHLHANLLPSNEEEFAYCRKIYLELVEKAISFGGTVSAEHGIGKLKHAFLEKMTGRKSMLEMARLKESIDRAAILGRGNIFPGELLSEA